MKRRKFLQSSALLSAPVILPGVSALAMPQSGLFSGYNNSDRVLVLIQLTGGNDGLNTLIPLDQYGNLQAVRNNVILPESSLLSIEDTLALHPRMTGIRNLYASEKVKFIQSVAYPNQNRSHFRSTDIWNSGSSADEFIDTGWLGRALDTQIEGYPEDFPNDDHPHPFALTLGSIVSDTCQGLVANYSLAVNNADNLSTDLSTGIGSTPQDGTYYADELDFLKGAIAQSNEYAEGIISSYDLGNNMADYPASDLSTQLAAVARLISGGLNTGLYVVSLGGFDTHAAQVAIGDTLSGEHAELLDTLSGAVAAFQEDLRLMDLEHRVVGMTYSEFGRRIRSNISFGTDHGTAAPMMVFGSCVQPGILGDNPVIDRQVDTDAGVPMQYDFRSIYGTVLVDWMQIPEDDVRSVLLPDFQRLPLFKDCAIVSIDDPVILDPVFTVAPNPCRDNLQVAFTLLKSEYVKLSIYDTLGKERIVVSAQNLSAGEHSLPVDMRTLSPGHYYVRLQAAHVQRVEQILRV